MNRTSSVILALVMLSCSSRQSDPFAGTIIDLSHTYDEHTIYWPTEKGFVLEKGFEGVTPAGYYYSAHRFWSPEHGGTHIDAPIHFHAERNTVDAVPLERLIGPGAVVDITAQCAEDRDYRVTVEDLLAWEQRQGKRLDGKIVLLRTGFGAFWPDRVRYMGTDERGEAAVPKLRIPGLHREAARWLAAERSIKAFGID
ncbi:MAG: cyclase family protein, partial [Bacteroidota bacterium]